MPIYDYIPNPRPVKCLTMDEFIAADMAAKAERQRRKEARFAEIAREQAEREAALGSPEESGGPLASLEEEPGAAPAPAAGEAGAGDDDLATLAAAAADALRPARDELPAVAPAEAGAYPDSPLRGDGVAFDDAAGPPLRVAPAEAGACPSSPHCDGGGFDAVSPDGPLPSQGRREEGCAEPAGRDVGERADTPLRHNEFSPARRAVFLHHLAQDGNVRTACSRVPISPQAAYLARRRCAVFRAGWDAALVHSREHALQVLANRALDGIREEVWHRGEKVGERVRHDARLLLAHLGRLDARAGDRQAQVHAERFDEILALVAGEGFADELVDSPTERGQVDAEPILPATRETLSDLAASAVWDDNGDDDEADRAKALTPQQREWAARDRVEARWDEWGMRVDIVNAAIEAGELPVVTEAVPEEDEEPPYEVKSLDGLISTPRLAGAVSGALAPDGRRAAGYGVRRVGRRHRQSWRVATSAGKGGSGELRVIPQDTATCVHGVALHTSGSGAPGPGNQSTGR